MANVRTDSNGTFPLGAFRCKCDDCVSIAQLLARLAQRVSTAVSRADSRQLGSRLDESEMVDRATGNIVIEHRNGKTIVRCGKRASVTFNRQNCAPLSAELRIMLTRAALNMVRLHINSRRREFTADFTSDPKSENPLDIAIQHDLSNCIKDAIQHLDEIQRQIVQLRFIERQPRRSIYQALGLSPKQLRNQEHRVRATLCQSLRNVA